MKCVDIAKFEFTQERHDEIVRRGLGVTLSPEPGERDKSRRRAIDYLLWQDEHDPSHQLDDYVLAAAKEKRPAKFLDCLPLIRDRETITVPITTEEWQCAGWAFLFDDLTDDEACSVARGKIDLTLLDRGFDLRRVRDAKTVRKMKRIAEAPKYIRDAEFLTVAEKLYLVEVTCNDGIPPELHEATKRSTVMIFKMRRYFAPESLLLNIHEVCDKVFNIQDDPE